MARAEKPEYTTEKGTVQVEEEAADKAIIQIDSRFILVPPDANAIYDFMIDLMHVQRNTGRFDFLMTDSEMDDWVQEISNYFIFYNII